MKPSDLGPLRFGSFEFDPLSGDLRKHKLAVRLTPLARVLLRELLSTPLRFHSREELQRSLWPKQTFLDFDHGLNKVVHALRQSLGDGGTNSRFIETAPGRGYRFLPEWLYADSIAAKISQPRSPYSIAVLPMNVTGTYQGLLFRCGRMTSDLTDALSAFPGLRVLAQGMVKSHHTPGASPQVAGEKMGVRAVLWGDLILHEAALFLRMELIDVSDGAQLSVACIERAFGARQDLEREIGDEVLRQLRPALLSLAEPTVFAVRN